MAIENADLLVLRQNATGEIRKATVGALLNQVVIPTVPDEIGDLDDVDTTGVTDGQMLVYDTDKWVTQDVPAGVDLSNYLQKPGTDGSFVIVENSGTISYSDTIDGGEYAT